MSGIRFTRGTVAPNLNEALRTGLNLPNEWQRDKFGRGIHPPGRAFGLNDIGNPPSINKEYARLANSHSEGIPIIIDFTLTPETFSILSGRVFKRIRAPLERYGYKFEPIPSLEWISNDQEAVVQMKDLTHEDLIGLGVTIWYQNESREFVGHTYEELSRNLGIGAETRQEQYQRLLREGRNPQELR